MAAGDLVAIYGNNGFLRHSVMVVAICRRCRASIETPADMAEDCCPLCGGPVESGEIKGAI